MTTGASPGKIEPFDTSLDPIMSNLANGRVILKFNSFVLVQENSSLSSYSNFILNLYIAGDLRNSLFSPVKLVEMHSKVNFFIMVK